MSASELFLCDDSSSRLYRMKKGPVGDVLRGLGRWRADAQTWDGLQSVLQGGAKDAGFPSFVMMQGMVKLAQLGHGGIDEFGTCSVSVISITAFPGSRSRWFCSAATFVPGCPTVCPADWADTTSE